jgi:hypothetical protein
MTTNETAAPSARTEAAQENPDSSIIAAVASTVKPRVKTIPLTRGKFALVDDEDYERIAAHRWYARPDGGKGSRYYAGRQGRRDDGRQFQILMHREVLWLQSPGHVPQVDHRDGDGLNNTRVNLRTATPAENQHNQQPRSGGTSIYKGVYWDRSRRCWRASIRLHGKTCNLGYFDTEDEAAAAYATAAVRLRGEFARFGACEAQP